jgi:N-acetylglucosamine-6-phosphate deacetylase
MKIIIVLFMLLLPLKAAFCLDPDTLTLRGRFYLDGACVTVKIVEGVIHSISRQGPDVDRDGASSGPDLWIAPGLIDIQINGYAGVDFADQDLRAKDMVRATRALWKAGVTSFLPTVTTNSRERLATSFRLLSEAGRDPAIAASIPGFHLEGPYISPLEGYRGAHMEEFVREPDWEEFQMLQEICDNGIKLVTVAPEIDGAVSFIRKAVSSGVVVSLGHHNGSPGQIRMAADAGATLSTHLGNGCANMIHRHNNPLWPQLAEDRLSASLIVDGHHLNRDEVICFYRMKGPYHPGLRCPPPGRYATG